MLLVSRLFVPTPIGKASGTLNMLRQLGRAFGVALCVAVFVRFGDRTTPQAFCDGFAAATSVAAMLSASLRIFMRLPASQRSSVILRDVLGYH